jgi:SnoaL-like domain
VVPLAHDLCPRHDDPVNDDAVTRYRAASEANDIDGVMQTLTSDVELVSPISGRMVFRGREDLRSLLAAVYGSLRGFRWDEEVGDSRVRLLIGEGFIGPLKLSDAMVLELAEDGRIQRFRPHLRPWLAVTLFALVLGAKVGRHPAIVVRALRHP